MDVMVYQQIRTSRHGAGERVLHRHHRGAHAAVDEREEHVLERLARLEPGAAAEQRHRRSFAEGARCALICRVGGLRHRLA